MAKRTLGRSMMGTLRSQVDSYLEQTVKPKPLQLLYASSPHWPFRSSGDAVSQTAEIGVLDSSFNPPQRAHYALATSARPAFVAEGNEEPKTAYDAILLLFSIRNADKGTGTSKDASPIQRLEMMQRMAKELEEQRSANVAVGIVEEPLMIAKSTIVHRFVQAQRAHETQSPCRLHWLVGFDTLERFFQVKYYPSPAFFDDACQTFFNKERTTFVCARRGIDSLPNKKEQQSQQSRQGGTDAESTGQPTESEQTRIQEKEQEERLLDSDVVKPWVEQGSVVMIDLDPSVQSVSSTAIRQTIADTALSDSDRQHHLRKMTTPGVLDYLLQTDVYAGNR